MFKVELPAGDANLDLQTLGEFIEPFCASSGTTNVTCEFRDFANVTISSEVGNFECQKITCQQTHPTELSDNWIYRLHPHPANDLSPLFYAIPPTSSSTGFFLPRNIAQRLEKNAENFDPSRMTFVRQGSQYTVFRYTTQGGIPLIIKRARIDTSTLKYMLRESAMCHYLQHVHIISMIECFSPIALLKDAADTYIVCVRLLAAQEQIIRDAAYKVRRWRFSVARFSPST
jgi:hypothetical protein